MDRKSIDWDLGKLSEGESALEHFLASRRWNAGTVLALVLGLLGVGICIFVVFRGVFGGIDSRAERGAFVALLLAFVFLRFRASGRQWAGPSDSISPVDVVLAVLAIATGVYTMWGSAVHDTAGIVLHLPGYNLRADHVVGIVVIGLVLEGARRSFGWIIVVIALFFIIHSLTASYWPGPFAGARAHWSYMVDALYVIEEGVYGIGSSVLLDMIFPFLLFSSLVIHTGASAFFVSLANSLVGRYSGGPAKAAVAGSAFLASITGSGIANVAGTGCVTIPMMKRAGFSPAFAGGVETVASTGSYFTPPVMGTAAFLIAAFTNTPYITICIYAAIPAALFYLGVFAQVHFRAKKRNLQGLAASEVPSTRRVMSEGGYLSIPIILIVVALLLGYSITMVAIWGILSVVVLSFVRKETRQSASGLLANLDRASSGMAGIAMCVVAIGIIQGSLMTSGLGMRLSLAVEYLAIDNIMLGLLLAGGVSMILGMGVNPLLVYIIVYIFVIPALEKIGAPVVPLHFFTLIYASLANITPPVAVAAYTAASIAQASPMKTGFEACKLGFAGYVVPFLIVLHPALLLGGGAPLVETVLALLTSAVGIFFLSAALEGWLFKRSPLSHRLLLAISGVCMLAPSLRLGVIGLVVFAFVALRQKLVSGEMKWI